jgi:hypothetical protein
VPLSYRIYSALGLVHVRYDGVIDMRETAMMMERYIADPGFRPAQKQLVDLSRATALDNRFVEMMALHARTAEVISPASETLLAYYAPTPLAVHLARTGFNSWSDVPGVIARIVTDDRAIADFFGLPYDALAGLLHPATP